MKNLKALFPIYLLSLMLSSSNHANEFYSGSVSINAGEVLEDSFYEHLSHEIFFMDSAAMLSKTYLQANVESALRDALNTTKELDLLLRKTESSINAYYHPSNRILINMEKETGEIILKGSFLIEVTGENFGAWGEGTSEEAIAGLFRLRRFQYNMLIYYNNPRILLGVLFGNQHDLRTNASSNPTANFYPVTSQTTSETD